MSGMNTFCVTELPWHAANTASSDETTVELQTTMTVNQQTSATDSTVSDPLTQTGKSKSHRLYDIMVLST